jgi:hypothetical protein
MIGKSMQGTNQQFSEYSNTTGINPSLDYEKK